VLATLHKYQSNVWANIAQKGDFTGSFNSIMN